MSGVPKTFFSSPIRYLRWAAHEKPAIFYSVIVGSMGPVFLLTVPRIRYALGDEDPPRIPVTYPVPTGPRKTLDGFDDPK